MSPTDLPYDDRDDEWKKFNRYFLGLLDPTNSDGIALFAFSRRILRQFHLGTYTEAELIIGVYMRAERWIQEDGATIPSPLAWIRKAAFTIARESSYNSLTPSPPDSDALNSILCAAILRTTLGRELEIVRQAFQQLNSEDQNLLNLRSARLLQQDIQSKPAEDTFQPESLVLRARKEEALRRLRDLYRALHSLSDLDS